MEPEYVGQTSLIGTGGGRVSKFTGERALRMTWCSAASDGRLDQVGGSLDAVINGLLKITGREPAVGDAAKPEVRFESARALGAVWALNGL